MFDIYMELYITFSQSGKENWVGRGKRLQKTHRKKYKAINGNLSIASAAPRT